LNEEKSKHASGKYFVPAVLHILLRLVEGTPNLKGLTCAREDYNKI
jgi:hypothetical protein